MAKFPKFFKKKNKDDKSDKGKKGKPDKDKNKKKAKSDDSSESDNDLGRSSVHFNESSNHISEIPSISPSSKNKVWHDKNDLQKNRQEALDEKAIERTREKVREAAQKELGAFATSKKIDMRVMQVMKGSPQEIGEYLQLQGVSMTASPAEMEEKIRNMVKNKLITDRSRSSFSTTQMLDNKVDAIMGLDREDILEYLELDEDSSMISPEWRKDEAKSSTPDLQSLSSDSSSVASFAAASPKPKAIEKDDDSEEASKDSPKPKKKSKSDSKKKSKKDHRHHHHQKKKDKKESGKESPVKAPTSQNKLSFSQPLPPKTDDDSSAASSEHSKMWFEDSPEKPKKKQVEMDTDEQPKTVPASPRQSLLAPPSEETINKFKDMVKRGSVFHAANESGFDDIKEGEDEDDELDVPPKTKPKEKAKEDDELEVPPKTKAKSPKTKQKKQVQLEEPQEKKGGDLTPPLSPLPGSKDSDSPPRKRAVRGLSRLKSAVVLTMEEALEREGVNELVKGQILRVMEEKNLGIESLEEALDEANERYFALKDKHGKFVAEHEELETLARNQQRKLEIVTRELEKPKSAVEEGPSLDKEIKEIETLREDLDEVNERISKLKSKEKSQEELESLCRRQQAQIERVEKDHFDRLKAKDTMNESMQEQVKTYQENLKEKDKIISMLQEKAKADGDDSKDNDKIQNIYDELVEKLKAKDNLIEALRDQVREVQKTNEEKSAEIKSLERQLREAKQQTSQSDGGKAQPRGLEKQASDRFNTTIVAEATPEDKLERQKKELEDKLEEVEEELVFAQGRIGALENQLKASAGGNTSAPGSDDQKDAEIKALKEQVETLENDLRYTVKDRDKKWNEKDAEIEKLKEELSTIQGAQGKGGAANPDEKEAKIKSLQEALDKSKEEADASIQKLENTVSELQEQIMKQMDNSKENDAPSSSDNKDDEIGTLKQRVEELENDLRSTVKDRDRKWNEKDQEIEKLKEQLQEVSNQSAGSEELKAQLEKEVTRANDLEKKLQAVQGHVKQKEEAVQSKQKELEEKKAMIRTSQTELQSLQDLLKQKDSTVETTQEKLQENEALIRSLQREIANQKTEAARLRTTPKLNTANKAALEADLDITKEDLREARRSLKLEMASNEKAKLQLLRMENDLENKLEELALMEKQTELSSLLQEQVEFLQQSLDKNRATIESQASQIESLKEELEMRSAVISRGDLDEILEAAQLNSELEKVDDELRREKTALKKAKKRITKLENNLKRGVPDSESASDLQQKLEHQMQISEVLAEQLQTSKASIESKTGVIESLKKELADKMEQIQSLEGSLGKKRKAGSSDSVDSDNTASMQKRIRKQLEEEIYELQRQLRKEQSMNKRSSKKIAKLEEELDDQLADWVALEAEMDETKAHMAKIESQLAKEQSRKRKSQENKQEKNPKRNSDSTSKNGGEDFNLYLDGLTRKVREARSQLETAHGKLDQAVSRHRVPSLQTKRNSEAIYSA